MAPIPALIDTTNTFYQWVLANVRQLNAQRLFGGIVDARDWPPKDIVSEQFYLAVMRDIVTKTRPQSFWAPLISEVVEWRWVVQGSNVPANAQSANRGDKYAITVQMIQELLSAHNPGYTQKLHWSITNDVNNNPVYISSPYIPPEFMWWNIPSFTRKQDRTTGMLYVAGQVEVSSYAPYTQNLGT